MSNTKAVDFCVGTDVHSDHVYEFLGSVSSEDSSIITRIMPRTKSDPRKTDSERNSDYNKALSLQTFDPLWMLSRQWQYGRFQGNDCGTPVTATVHTVRKLIDDKVSAEPLEYEVEKVNYEMTAYVRAESAMFLKKSLLRIGLGNAIVELNEKYPLSEYIDELNNATTSDEALDKLKTKKNKALKKFSNFYAKRCFDGYKVYLDLCSDSPSISLTETVRKKYIAWFENKFLPNKSGKDSWNFSKLAYEVSIKQGNTEYSTDQYASGTLSWYSFDVKKGDDAGEVSKSSYPILTYIPTPAKFSGAPAQRLWELENRRVVMGNNNIAPEYIATSLIMQYISTYSNDWMITPLETETGSVLDVEYIEVKDSFNDVRIISKSAEFVDKKKSSDGPTDRWCLFGSSKSDAYYNRDFSCNGGLLFPPTVIRCEEGSPIEEVQFLRDEMSNMLWGVETKINDGCGGYLDGKTLSDAVFKEVDLQRKIEKDTGNVETGLSKDEVFDKKTKDEAKYALLIQNRVPLNWIPFVPEQLQNGRDIVFRRGRMPIYYKDRCDSENADGYKSVRPSTKLLDKSIKPFYINEEEIGGYGVKVTKTPQRTRWFMGESYNWIGNRKVISEYQANSGLMFDELLRKDGGVVETERKKQTSENGETK